MVEWLMNPDNEAVAAVWRFVHDGPVLAAALAASLFAVLTVTVALARRPRGYTQFSPDGHPCTPDIWPGAGGVKRRVKLQHGWTQFYLHGPEDGRRVVLVHGVQTPAVVFRLLADALAAAGCRVLSFDLYGRGFSDVLDSQEHPCTKELFLSQMTALLHQQGWTHFTLIGFSMGGAIATSYAALFPKHIVKLVLIAPGGLMRTLPLIGRVASIPVLRDVLVQTILPRLVLQTARQAQLKASQPHIRTVLEVVQHQIRRGGLSYIYSFLSTIVHFPLTRLQGDFANVGASLKTPILVVWGDEDAIVPFPCWGRLRLLVPSAQLLLVKGAGHDTFNELPDLVIPEMVSWITGSHAYPGNIKTLAAPPHPKIA